MRLDFPGMLGDPSWLSARIGNPVLRRLLVLGVSLLALAAGTWLMSQFLIAEGAITLAAFPLSFAIVGTLYLGPMVALAWGLTVFGAFAGVFGVALPWAAAYGFLYGAATLFAIAALKQFDDVKLLQQPAKSLLGWYLVVGLAAPVATTVRSSCQSSAVCSSPFCVVARGNLSLTNITPWPTNTSSSIVTPSHTNVWLWILQRAPITTPRWISTNGPTRVSSPIAHP